VSEVEIIKIPSRLRIDANLVNPFFEAFYEHLRQIVPEDVTFQLGDFHLRNDPNTTLDINVTCNMTGKFTARIVMSMDTRVALEIAEVMFGSAVDSFESEAQSAVTELMNIIIGNSFAKLGVSTQELHLTPTMLTYGRPVRTTVGNSILTLCRHIHTGWGEVEFNMSIDTTE